MAPSLTSIQFTEGASMLRRKLYTVFQIKSLNSSTPVNNLQLFYFLKKIHETKNVHTSEARTFCSSAPGIP